MHLLYAQALHIIFVVTWFAGLFYIVRLFIYHVEAEDRSEEERHILQAQYKIMEKRLWYYITWPSMILALLFGFWVAGPYLKDLGNYNWLILKLALVLGLVLYHLQCGKIYRQLQNDEVRQTSFRLRLWNEMATLFLVAIVFVIVFKDAINWLWGIGGLVIIGVLMWIAIRAYRKKRESTEEETLQ